MSKNSDIELLSVEALETYARFNHLSGADVQKLFDKHQTLEKIELQHEYLHQVDSDDLMDYVNEVIRSNITDIILFHGSTFLFSQIELSKSKNKRDFGKGFYTTVFEEQAREWGYRLGLRKEQRQYYVYQFIYKPSEMLKIKQFDTLNREWLRFVVANRMEGGLQHDYDVVVGPIADDNTMETIQLHMAGVYNEDETLERLKYFKPNNQVSFHTLRALESLKLVERKDYD